MNRRWLKRTLFALLGGASGVAFASAEQVEHAGALYHLYRIDRAEQRSLQLVWQDDDQKPLGSFTALRRYLQKKNQRIAFASNAGIFGTGPAPLGLAIANGKELVPLNLKSGEGNFYLKPNGVFFLDDTLGPGIMESNEFARCGIKPRLAAQGGPLLLRNDVMHPAFNEHSPNKRLRNGVGIRAQDGQVIFVISDRDDSARGRVTFHQFAEFFHHLGCRDALFLDGDISDMLIDPTPDQKIAPNTFGAMFVIPK